MIKTINSQKNDQLISWLKTQRQEKHLTMRQLAERLGCSHSFVGKTEQGERRLDVVEFIKYCEALGVSPVDGLTHIISD